MQNLNKKQNFTMNTEQKRPINYNCIVYRTSVFLLQQILENIQAWLCTEAAKFLDSKWFDIGKQFEN